MKKTAAIFLILIFLLQHSSQLIIYFSFKLRQQQIARTLCVKKDEPGNSCQGNCFLKKQLTQSAQEENKELPASNKENELTYIPGSGISGFKEPLADCLQKIFSLFQCPLHSIRFNNGIFHPPSPLSA